jgi:hypothetical protein
MVPQKQNHSRRETPKTSRFAEKSFSRNGSDMGGENVILEESCFKLALCLILTRCFEHDKLVFHQYLRPYFSAALGGFGEVRRIN